MASVLAGHLSRGFHAHDASEDRCGIARRVKQRAALRVAEIVRPKLVMDGMFLVGLDIVGDKLMEINVFSPGGLGNAHKMTGIRFERPVIEALDRKVQYARYYRRNFSNVEMATL